MIYTVSCLASLKSQCLVELLALPVKIHWRSQSDGFITISVECDAPTAAMIAKRWHVSEV